MVNEVGFFLSPFPLIEGWAFLFEEDYEQKN